MGNSVATHWRRGGRGGGNGQAGLIDFPSPRETGDAEATTSEVKEKSIYLTPTDVARGLRGGREGRVMDALREDREGQKRLCKCNVGRRKEKAWWGAELSTQR